MLLTIKNLTVNVQDTHETSLVNDMHLEISEGSVVALVGGSGSGKTTTGLSILRLLPFGLKMTQGQIIFQGENILEKTENQMRQLRGKEISMVFQEPLTAFNPVFSIGTQIDEVLRYHTAFNAAQRRERVMELLRLVGVDDPQRVAAQYPHQLSGGLRQRAMIAQAIAGSPKLLIADEPTSNLDVTLQAKIIELFIKLKTELKLSILLITHDLGMVQYLADHVAVMRLGQIVEQGKIREVIQRPAHSYTRQLIEAI